jgi:hypothetical protein
MSRISNPLVTGAGGGGAGSGVGPHNLLSSTHTDTQAASPASGSLVVGVGNEWQALPSGNEGEVLSIFTGQVAWSSSLALNSGIFNTIIVNSGTFTNITVLNSGIFNTIIANTGIFNTLVVNSGTFTTLVVNSGIFTTIVVNSGVFTNLTVLNSGTINNLTVNNLTVNSGLTFNSLTVNNLTVVSGANLPAFDVLVVNPGGTSSLGTVISGVWNGDVIEEPYGGTGQSSYNPGDILYSNAANVLTVLPSGAEGDSLQIIGGTLAWGP